MKDHHGPIGRPSRNPWPLTNYTPAPAANVEINLSISRKAVIQLPAGNITMTVINSVPGQLFTIKLIQDAIGARTVTWFAGISWAEGGFAPTLTVTADLADKFIFTVTAVDTYDGFIIGQDI